MKTRIILLLGGGSKCYLPHRRRNFTDVGMMQVEFRWVLWMVIMYKVDSCDLWFIGQYSSGVEFGTVLRPAIHMLTCIPAVSCAWNISIYSISTSRFCGWRTCELYTRTLGVSITLMYGRRQAVMSFQMHMFMQVWFACLTLLTLCKGVNVSQNCSFCTKWRPIIWYYT